MNTQMPRPWTDMVMLHPDVEAGELTESIFAIDLGAIAVGDENVPEVYRHADAFFQATHLTADLGKILEEILASLDGQGGYNRVLKLRSPFGGGKSHTLASVLHAARSRSSLDRFLETREYARPDNPAVAVFDGEKFDAYKGRVIQGGPVIRTMWGWLAWQIDPKRGYPIVAGHDQDRVAPGGDVIQELLTSGADGRPVLILLDEVLKYLERSAAVTVQDSTLQRQTKDFFQNLSVEVAGSKTAAMVYSLIWSAREALDNSALLDEIDKLASRVDQLREPVTGEEVLEVLKRRLLGQQPDKTLSDDAAAAYASAVSRMLQSHSVTSRERKEAEKSGVQLRARINAAYPFHPALIDIMRERWASVDAFQRTRGALRFLASCMHSVKKEGRKRPLLGPGDVPLDDGTVRIKLLKELGAQNDYDSVIIADLAGPNSRAGQIDDRLAKETPRLTDVRPATQVATTIFLHSFGGLRREGENETETLPSGVNESDLLAACVGPNLDSITAKAVLADLRNSCLYLHYDGVRYCFRKEQNVTKLIEDAEQEVSREEADARGFGPVRERIKEILKDRVAAHPTAVVWMEDGKDIPDGIPQFWVGYLPLEFAAESGVAQKRTALDLLLSCHTMPRRYRNGLGLAIPNKKQVEPLRRAVRHLLAIERIIERKVRLRLPKEQNEQIQERKRTEERAVTACLQELYREIWFPRMRRGEIEIEKAERGSRPLRGSGIHERIKEIITNAVGLKVYDKMVPEKIIERVGLGELVSEDGGGCLGINVSDVVEAFYRDIAPPKIESSDVIRQAISEGVEKGVLGYCVGSPTLGPDGKYQVPLEKVCFSRRIDAAEIDLASGFLITPSAIPEPPKPADEKPPNGPGGTPPPPPGGGDGPGGGDTPGPDGGPDDGGPVGPGPGGGPGGPEDPPSPPEPPGVDQPARPVYRRVFRATRKQIFESFLAVANLTDKSDDGKVTVVITGTAKDGYDQVWLRNAVDEPLTEAAVEDVPDDPGGPDRAAT